MNAVSDAGTATADVVIIGGGIAGVSAGYMLTQAGLSVHLVEAEETLAHHSTGRSAAQYLETYGNETVRRLTASGRAFFSEPPDELVDGPLWTPRVMMEMCTPGSADHMRTRVAEVQRVAPTACFLEPDEAIARLPVLRPELVGGAMFEPDAMELDVPAIHQAFVRGLRRAGSTISPAHPVTGLRRVGDDWIVETPSGTLTAPVVVNAAGAWCDRVAVMAGVEPIGLHPCRRTAAVAALPDSIDATDWPLVAFEGAGGGMAGYAKPEPGGLLISPADETPSEPCDARPEEIDVARAIEAVNSWTTLELRHVRSTWAGLRTFASDRTLVAGFAPDAPGFFWLAGQGGYGIQTSPGMAMAAAGLIVDGELPSPLTERGVTPADLAPDREGLGGDLIPDH